MVALGDKRGPYNSTKGVCLKPGCTEKVYAKRKCRYHYLHDYRGAHSYRESSRPELVVITLPNSGRQFLMRLTPDQQEQIKFWILSRTTRYPSSSDAYEQLMMESRAVEI